ncbi:MAG: chloride channel protein [Candidatus Heimdallarchaeaceae archaeon]
MQGKFIVVAEEKSKPTDITQLRNRFKRQIRKYWKYSRKWFPFSILIGIVSGIIMAIFTSLIVNLQSWLTIIPVYITYPIVGGITSLLIYFGFKEVKGAGISYVLAHKNTNTSMKSRTIFTKFFTSVLTLGVNAPAGREGPAVTVGSTTSTVLADKLKMTKDDQMHAITIGAAACTAAVFRAPLGGTLFAAEVPYKHDLDETVFFPALVASAISLLIYDSLLHLISSISFLSAKPVYLELGNIQFTLSFSSSLHFILIGIIAGFLGIIFSLLFKLFSGFIERYLKAFLLPIIGMILTTIVVFFVDTYFFPQEVKLSGTGFSSINHLVENLGGIGFEIVLVLLLGKILVTSTCIGFGNSAGVMGPTLITGAALGYLYSRLFNLDNTLAIAMIVVGMSTMHTATTKTPIASMILVLEMAGFPNLIIPLILSNAISFIISMDFSLYKGQIQSKEVILRRSIKNTDLLETITVETAMNDNYKLLKENDLLADVFQFLNQYKVSALPVINAKKELCGVVSSGDFQKGFSKGQEFVHEVMTRDIIVAYPDETLSTVFDKLTDHRIENLPVLASKKQTKVIGVISFIDIESYYEKAMIELRKNEKVSVEDMLNDF